MTKEERLKLLSAHSKSLIAFGKYVSDVEFDFPTPPFHYEIEAVYHDKTIKYAGWQAPRGTAKSTVLAAWAPLHHIIHDTYIPKKYVFIQSKSRQEGIKRIRTIKNILEKSKAFRDLYGYWGKDVCPVWREDYVILPDGSTLDAKGTGTQMKGLKEDNLRPTLAIIDDAQDRLNTNTPEQMMKHLEQFLELLPGLDKKYGRLMAIGTPIDMKDIISTCERMDNFYFRRYSIADDEAKTTLWPEHTSYEEHLTTRASYEAIGQLRLYNSEHMCTIMSKNDQIFCEEDMRYYSGDIHIEKNGDAYLKMRWTAKRELGAYEYDKYGKFLPEVIEEQWIPVNIFYGVDRAYSLDPKANYTVILPIAMDAYRNIYVLPFIRERVYMDVMIEQIVSENKRLTPKLWTIENNGTQKDLSDTLKKLEKVYIPGIYNKNIPPGKDKAYLQVLQPYHKQHKIFLTVEMRLTLEMEMLYYPKAQTDDILDGLYWAAKHAYPADHDLPREQPKKRKKLYNKKESERTWMSR